MATMRKCVWQGANGEAKTAWRVDYGNNYGKRRSKQFDHRREAEAWLAVVPREVSNSIHMTDSQIIEEGST